jgi:stress response protein YsnF
LFVVLLERRIGASTVGVYRAARAKTREAVFEKTRMYLLDAFPLRDEKNERLFWNRQRTEAVEVALIQEVEPETLIKMLTITAAASSALIVRALSGGIVEANER